MFFSFYSLEYFHTFAYCCFTDASSKASLFLIIALITFLSVASCGFFPFFFSPSFCCTAYHSKTYWFKTTWFCGVVCVLFLFKLIRTPQLRWLGRRLSLRMVTLVLDFILLDWSESPEGRPYCMNIYQTSI